MNTRDYITCLQNIHRDTHDIIRLNTLVHEGLIQSLIRESYPMRPYENITSRDSPIQQQSSPIQQPSSPIQQPPLRNTSTIARTPAHIIRRTTPAANYVNLNHFLQPIEVAPSVEEIDANTTMTFYENIDTSSNTECPIRNDTFQPSDIVIRINRCGHIFFVNEFYGWFRSHVHCPLCRRDIRETTTPAEPDNLTNHHTNGIFPDEHVTPLHPDIDTTSAVENNSLIQSNDLLHNILQHELFNVSNGDSDLSLNNNFHIQNGEILHMQTDNQINSLQMLTETIATEVTNQLQNNIAHSDISNSGIELSLSFGSY